MEQVYTLDQTKDIATQLLQHISPREEAAVVIALSGELGAGKTTLTQTIAEMLKVKEVVQSPTFVIAKFYEAHASGWDYLIHIDAYRIENSVELITLGWDTFCAQPRTLIIVEWPERVADIIPTDAYRVGIEHTDTARTIKYHGF